MAKEMLSHAVLILMKMKTDKISDQILTSVS